MGREDWSGCLEERGKKGGKGRMDLGKINDERGSGKNVRFSSNALSAQFHVQSLNDCSSSRDYKDKSQLYSMSESW